MTEQRSNSIYSATSGTTTTDAFITILRPYPPSLQDINYPVGKRWVDTASNVDYILANLFNQNGVVLANWIPLSSGGPGSTEKLEGNSGGPVGPDGSSIINVVGDASTINIIGDPQTHTLTANVILPSDDYSVLVGELSSIKGVAPGVAGQVLQTNGPGQLPSWESVASSTEKLEGNSGGVVSPDGSSVIQVLGDTKSINIVGDPQTHTLTANVILPSTDFSVLFNITEELKGIAPGTSGQFLQTNGPGQAPSWETVPSGPGGGTSIDPDVGSNVSPVNSVIKMTGYPYATSQTPGIKTLDGGTNVLQISNLLGVSPYVVGKDTNLYHFQSINSAITAAVQDGASASQPALIYVTPGNYAENLFFQPYVYVVGYGTGYSEAVVVTGQASNGLNPGTYFFANLTFKNTGSTLLFGGQANNVKFYIENCKFETSGNGTTITISYENAIVQFINCLIQNTGGNQAIDLQDGFLTIANSIVRSSATSTFSSGTATFLNSILDESYSISSCNSTFYGCFCDAKAQTFINVASSTLQLFNCVINSTSANGFAINQTSGSTIIYGNLIFPGTAKKIVDTFTALPQTIECGNLSFDGGYTTNSVDGGLWIGSATGVPKAAQLTAGSGITITNAANSITIASTGSGGGTTWQSISTQTQAQAGNGYFITAATTLVLPASPTNGETIQVVSKLTSGNVFIDANQKTISGGVVSGNTGASSTQVGDTMTLVYDATSQSWNATSMIGSWVIS
jgi:hypothetical protein